MHVKVVCHSSLPLAWATSGVGELDHVSVSQRLRQFDETVSAEDLDNRNHFVTKVDDFFRPLVEQEKGFPEYAANPDKVMLGLHVAWFAGAAIDGGLLVIDPPDEPFFDPIAFRISAEGPVYAAMTAAFPDDALLEGQQFDDACDLAAHFRHLIQIGAAAEREAQHGRRLMIGGPVDVAHVDRVGARRL